MMTVDCHTHWTAAWQGEDAHDPSRWLAVLDRHQVTHAIVLPTVGLFDDAAIPSDNADVAAVCRRSNGRMLPFCTANIWQPATALAELERCLRDEAARGIKFHPWLQGCSVSATVMDEVCELAVQFDVPILFHDGTPPFSLPAQIGLLALRHPQAQLILGHCGLFEHFREAAAAIADCANLWGCLCGPHLAGMRHLISVCGVDRLLWGSDQGFSPADCIDYRLGLLNCLGLAAAARQAILTDNPRRLLRF